MPNNHKISPEEAALFVRNNRSLFPHYSLMGLKNRLIGQPFDVMTTLTTLRYKSPTVTLLISIFLGYFGADRFYVGDVLLGALKLITGGGCGIWWFCDVFVTPFITKRRNLDIVYSVIE